jgi:hypothetical protein
MISLQKSLYLTFALVMFVPLFGDDHKEGRAESHPAERAEPAPREEVRKEEIRPKAPNEPASHPMIPYRPSEERADEHRTQYPLPTMNRSIPVQNRVQGKVEPFSKERFTQFVQSRLKRNNTQQENAALRQRFISGKPQIQSQNLNANRIRQKIHTNGYHRNWFNANFYESHHYHPSYYRNGVNWWRTTGWNSIITWLPWGYGVPVYYAEGYPIPLSSDEYNGFQGYELPDQDQGPVEGDWLPLGVYAVVSDITEYSEPTKFFQLVLDRQGNIAGTYYNQQTDQVHAVSGMVDQQNQLVAFQTESPNAPTVYTGLYNLTQPQTSVTVVFPTGQTELRYLIRLQE